MNEKRKVLIYIILVLMIVSVVGISSYYWYNNAYYISTEDAKVTADMVKAAPQISAKLLEVDVKEGDIVEKDQILARQEMTGIDDSKLETTVIRAPIAGIVVKKQGTVGEVFSPGQTLAILVDPTQIYVNANIEETKLSKLAQGQKVDVTIDQYKGTHFTGKVASIGEASASSFSLLPSSSSGNFTKVIQKVPVKIELDSNNSKLLSGTNAVVKIHIR